MGGVASRDWLQRRRVEGNCVVLNRVTIHVEGVHSIVWAHRVMYQRLRMVVGVVHG